MSYGLLLVAGLAVAGVTTSRLTPVAVSGGLSF